MNDTNKNEPLFGNPQYSDEGRLTEQEWIPFVATLANVIDAQFSTPMRVGLGEQFDGRQLGKYMVMLEFLRLIRGESFDAIRPLGLPSEVTKHLYEQEDRLQRMLSERVATMPGLAESDQFRLYLQELTNTVT